MSTTKTRGLVNNQVQGAVVLDNICMHVVRLDVLSCKYMYVANMELYVTHQVINYLLQLLRHVSIQIQCDIIHMHML